jgi:glycosyltransferase involved in cell wall biosynthesis
MSFAKKISWIFFAAGAKPTFAQWALAERLAEIESVIIVDRPVSLLRDRKAPPLNARCNFLIGVEGCWHYRPLHYPERLPGIGRIFKLKNQRRLQQELNQLLPHDGKRIVCFDSPTQDHLVGKLGEDISIYLAIDDKTLTVWGEPIHGELEAEKRLLSKVDKAVCVSETLAEVLRSRVPNGRTLPLQVLPNGYDERIFDPNKNFAEPTSIADIPRPRILVAGHVSERIDWDGIIGASRLRPQWAWIFVGPADKGMKEKIANTLGEHGFYHPPIPVQDVPAWISHCDACAVPYRLNPFTRASSPLKAIEYLAMGAPVLSTRILSLERYDGAIEWVNEGDGESYAWALDTFVNPSRNKELGPFRQQAVAGDSWGVRVNQFREIVFNAIP